MEKVLFLDACVRDRESRTKKLCDTYIQSFMKAHPDAVLETVTLRRGAVQTHTEEKLEERDEYIRRRDFSQPMFDLARQYQEADYIIIGTPYWDLSFAAILKVYVENIIVADLTFRSTDAGFVGLCRGRKMVYITTAGGSIGGKNYGYDYMCAIAEMTGIDETQCIKADMLDIVGYDADAIMAETIKEIQEMF